MLAMLYLMLFATLALGFYGATNVAVQVSTNETHGRRAMLAAESGMEFMRYTLGNVDIPHFTPADQLWSTLCTQVKQQLDGTRNVNGATLPDPSGESMTIPTVHLPSGGTFTATLLHNGEKVTAKIVATAPDGSVGRTIQMDFSRATRASNIFDFGVASKSKISMSGNAKITGAAGDLGRGSVLSDTTAAVPLSMTGKPSISGDFSYTNPSGAPTFGNGTVAGFSPTAPEFADHVHGGVTAPEFPVIDSSSFATYVPSATAPAGPQVITTSNPPGSSFTNIRIKAGANPKFSGGSILRGVVYIETPNQITFSGGVTIQGVIVVQNNPTGDPTTNTIKFSGNVTHQGVETLPDAAPFAGLPKLTGSFLLAPTFGVTMTGNSNQVGGTIVTSSLDISGTAGANVKGTVINLSDTSVNLTGTSDIVVSSTGTTNYPAGVTFGTHFAPLPDTYQELQ
jgi:hypothetical protein